MPYLEGIQKIHFIGAGGISLSALAKLMLIMGIKVSGSDLLFSPKILELMEAGADIWIGSNPDLIGKPDLAVYSSAVPENDKELIYCRTLNIPVLERFAFLGRIATLFEYTVAIGGTHGKTTASGMLSNIFKEARQSFCSHIGGEVIGLGNLYYTGDKYFITEACEYRKSLLSIPAHIALVLNAERDHPDTYSSLEEVYTTFDTFLFQNINSLSIVCSDTPYYKNHLISNNKLLTYGTSNDSTFTISNIEEYKNGYFSFLISYLQEPLMSIKMNTIGYHNIYNAGAAIAVSSLLHIDTAAIKRGIENFEGVKRRFEKKGMVKGANVYHDYAHHPSEIKAVLESARSITKGKLYVVFQPHTYSRTSQLIDEFSTCFKNCDELYIVKEYAAREKKSSGITAYDLFKKIERKNTFYYEETLSLAKHLIKVVQPFDMILVLGAGDIDCLCDLLI